MTQEKFQTTSMQNFGGVKEVHYGIVQVVNCNLVHLRLKRPGSSDDETIDILALTFPVICSPLPSREQTNFAHLEGLKLADDFDGLQDTIILMF